MFVPVTNHVWCDPYRINIIIIIIIIIKAKLTKCEFLKSGIEFFGHFVDGDGIHTVDSKIIAVQKFPTPKSVEDERSFLGYPW